MEPTSNTDLAVMGTSSSRFAMPQPRATMSLPLRTIPRAQPGESGLLQVAKSLSTFAALALSLSSPARAHGGELARVTKASRLHRQHLIRESPDAGTARRAK